MRILTTALAAAALFTASAALAQSDLRPGVDDSRLQNVPPVGGAPDQPAPRAGMPGSAEVPGPVPNRQFVREPDTLDTRAATPPPHTAIQPRPGQ